MNIFGKIILSLLITSNVLVFSVSAVKANPEETSELRINKINMFLSRLAEEAPKVLNALKSYFEASFISGVNPESFVVRDGEDDYLSNRENKINTVDAQYEDGFFKFMVCLFEQRFGADVFDD